jgi:hypothetical protein
MVHTLALETANGATVTFTSPVPGKLTPTLNGRTRTVDFVVLSSTQVQFAAPPAYDDVVGFFVETT